MDSMKEAILQAKSRFGKIDGVIHSAMVSRDGTLDNMDEEAFRAALAPKVTGSVILREVTQQEPLDFMMFFSSFASFSGNAGASNYVAGCAFEDAFAEHLDHSEPYPVRVINWGYWGNVGSGAREDLNERFTALGFRHIKPEEGMETVRRVLGNRESQILAFKAEEHLLKLLGIDLEHRIELRPESIPSLIETMAHQDYPFLELDEADMDKATAAFERFSQCLLLDAFRRMEVFVEGGERYEKDQLREHLRIAPEYHRLYEALLDILARAGFVELEGQAIVTSQQLGDGELQRELEGLEEKGGELLSIYPEMEAYVKVVWTCLSNYPAILRGEIAATDVLFPGGSMELVEGLYKGDIVQDHFNSLAVQSIRSYVQARRSSSKNNEKIKIIEVGAGTGGTSAPVLEAISEYGEQVHYLYTDISVAFTRYGKAEYADPYPFVEFKVLNLERDVEEQGYAPGDFDVVLAANVLHATKRLRDTLRNVKTLLKTNGWLVINEATEVQDFATMAFGLLDGWWLFEDEENRMKYSPLLSQSMWQRLLKEEGFERVLSLGTRTTRGQGAPCDVLIAESNGEVRRRTQASHRDERGLRTSRSDDTQTKSYKEVSESRSGYSAVVAFLVDMFARLLGVAEEELDIHADVAEYGLDSIMASKAFMVMQGEYGDALTAQDMMSYSTIDSLASFIAEHAAVAGGAEAPSDSEYKTNTGQFTGPIMQIPDAELAAAQDRSSIIAEVCGLTVLAFFQKMGLFRRAEDGESVDGLQTTLHVHPDGMPLLNTLLYILVEQGVLHVDGETICLSEHGQSAEMQSRLGGLESRIELIQRAVPELSPHFALLKHCADHYQQILEGQISPESVFASEPVQSWIAELYKRDNWGSDQAYPWFLQYFAQSFAQANLVQGNRLRILECGDILSNLGRALLESLPPNAEEVECYYLDGSPAHRELKAEIYNATYPKVSFKAIENTDELTISGNGPNNFDVIVLHTDLSDTTKLRRQLEELKNVARPDGLLAAGNPVELEFLRLTFGLVDKRWLYESELSSGNENSSWISVFEDLGFHVRKVVGDWLVVASQEAQNGAIKKVDLAATSAAVQTKDAVSLQPRGGHEDGESPVSTEVESYYGVNRRSFEVRSGRQYEVVTCGHGEPIIFLTGLSFTWRIWEFQTAALSGQYQLVFPHLPGHEGSRFNGEPFTFESLTDDLADVMDQCNLSSGHLVGWCMSGNIAQLFALRHPEKLRSLVLIGTTPGDARTRGLNTEDVIDYAHDPIDTYELEFRNIFKEFSFRANFTDQYLTFLRQTSCKVEVGPVLYYLDSLFRFDSTTFLQDIRVPTLVMAGKWDIAFPVDQIELLHRGIPNSIFFEFGKSGHLPFLTQHDLFNHQLTSFLHEIETRKGNPESSMAV